MTRRGFVLAVLLGLGAPAWASPGATVAATGSIQGVVTRAGSGLTLPHTSVTLRSQTDPLVQVRTSDKYGGFRFEAVPPGLYSLEATRVGFDRAIVSPILVFSGHEATEHVVLERDPPSRRPTT